MNEFGYKVPLYNRIINLQENSRAGILSYLFIPFVLLNTIDSKNLSQFFILYITIFSILSIYRFYLTYAKISKEYKKQFNWMSFFYFITIIQAIMLGGFWLIIINLYPLYGFHSYFITMAILSYSTASALTLSVFPLLANLYSGFALSFVAVGMFIYADDEFKIYTILGIILFFMITNILIRRQYRKFNIIQEMIQKQNQKLESTSYFLNNLPGLASIFDENLQYFDCNDQLLQLLKVKKEDIVGKPLGFLNTNSVFINKVEEFYHGYEYKTTFEIIYKNTNFLCILIKNNTSAGVHISSLSIDITELRKKEKDLENKKIQLIESEKLITMGELASGLAHEINNPMAIITGRVQVMQKKMEYLDLAISDSSLSREKLNELLNFDFFKTNLSKIIDVSMRIKKIVQSLKIISKETNTTIVHEYQTQDILEPLMALYNHRLFFNGIKFIFENNHPIEVVKCDLAELSQAVLYIIKYAIESIKGIDEKWFRVEVHTDVDTIQFWFINSGLKFTEKLYENIFGENIQQTNFDEFSNVEIGLVSAIDLMKKQGGRLFFKKDYPNNCFVIELEKAD